MTKDQIIEAKSAQIAELQADRDRAQSACTAWQQVFESIEAYLQDRVAMDDPGKPATYLEIIRGDVANIKRSSEQIVAARWAHYRMQEAQIADLKRALDTARHDAMEEAKAVENQTLAFVARWAWRTDPPNASRQISDTDRLGCIKHHPIIKRYAKPHIDLAAAEARALQTKDQSHGA